MWENAPSEETRGCHTADNRHRVWSTNDLYPRVVFVGLGGGGGCGRDDSLYGHYEHDGCDGDIDNVIYSGSSQKLTSRDLTQFAHHVARGMEYLSSKKVRLYL